MRRVALGGGAQHRAALLTAPTRRSADTGAAAARTRDPLLPGSLLSARPAPLLTSRYYLDIINKIIVQHQIVQ